MSYDPSNVNKRSLVFFGASASDQKLNSDSGLYFDSNQLYAPQVIIPNDAYIGSAGANSAIKIDSNGKVTIAGDLEISGSTTTVATETLTVDDNLIVLNNNVTGSPSENGGIELERGDESNVQLLWNEADDQWQFTNDGSIYYDMFYSLSTSADSGTGSIEADDTVTMTGGSGVATVASGSGFTFNVDINKQSLGSTVDPDNDYMLMYDATDGSLVKVTPSSFVSAASTSYFNIGADNGGDDQVDLGQTIDFTGGNGIVTTVSDNEVTFALSLNELTDTALDPSSDTMVFVDSDDSNSSKKETIVDFMNAVAGSALATDNDGVLDVQVDSATVVVNGSGQLEVGTVPSDDVSLEFGSYTSTGSITSTNNVVLASGGAGGITLTLPAVSANKKIMIKKVDSDAGAVTVSPNGSEEIDGANASKALYYENETITLVSNGTAWYAV